MIKAGIVIINYNSIKYLNLVIQSLIKAKTKIPFSIGIIDNGSSGKEKSACRELMLKIQNSYPDQNIAFFDVEKNLGFSGGNNVVIKEFLKDSDISHICLLNSDVIVTDFWLDYLIEKNCDVIGPVTNAAGNEQTVYADYTVSTDGSAVGIVNEFAKKRHDYYCSCITESQLVTFFAVVMKRKVVEKVGLLDEQFYPGSYEDDDYCIRIRKAGFQINIARDCYVHHFGSASFSQLAMSVRQDIGNVNRERFEKKWDCRWKDRTWKVLESCRQDIDYITKNSRMEWQRNQINASLVQIEQLLEEWGEAIQFFTYRPENMEAAELQYSMKQLTDMILAKVKRKEKEIRKSIMQKFHRRLCGRAERKAELSGMERICALIHDAEKNGCEAVCVFAPMYNKENERDGYIQRVKAIDLTVLTDLCRIYLYDEGDACTAMRFDFIDEMHGYIVFNSRNEEHLNAVFRLVKMCRKTYIHSLLRFIEDRSSRELWQIFDFEDVMHIWDVHGMVPEEYALSGSELGCQLADNIEKVLAEKADTVVVVTKAMEQCLKQKYPDMRAEIVVVPILNEELLEPARCSKKKAENEITIVYAGGMQPWQNIGLMQRIIQKSCSRYRFKIFVPNPQEFWNMWADHNITEKITVESKAPSDLYQEYEDCDFGFVLRDDSTVNIAACPTKIIEYLRFGIIPIFKSEKIGDFVDMGLKYISFTEVIDEIEISDKEKQDMISDNYEVLARLKEIYKEGLKKLKKQVER